MKFGLMWRFLRQLAYLLEAETAHKLSIGALKTLVRIHPKCLRLLGGRGLEIQPKEVWGMKFLNPIGLAAGFDKNAEIVEALPYFGFGFVEIGSVTPRPQFGNPRPRLFRDIKTERLFNAMGFNNEGAKIIAERVRRAKSRLPEYFRIGVNIGKNRDTASIEAFKDYAEVAREFLNCADFFVLNVSSPNTPGLRELQGFRDLSTIVDAVKAELQKTDRSVPVLVKLSPEFFNSDRDDDFWRSLSALPVEGLVLTNTLSSSWQGRVVGESGSSLQLPSKRALQVVKSNLQKPIISVGGIQSPAEAKERFEMGADLLEFYTAWVYEGPSLASDILRNL